MSLLDDRTAITAVVEAFCRAAFLELDLEAAAARTAPDFHLHATGWVSVGLNLQRGEGESDEELARRFHEMVGHIEPPATADVHGDVRDLVLRARPSRFDPEDGIAVWGVRPESGDDTAIADTDIGPVGVRRVGGHWLVAWLAA